MKQRIWIMAKAIIMFGVFLGYWGVPEVGVRKTGVRRVEVRTSF